jgi:hypothetical protein
VRLIEGVLILIRVVWKNTVIYYAQNVLRTVFSLS